MKRFLFLFGIAIVMWPQAARPQWQSSVMLSTSYDSNTLRNYTQQEDVVTQANVLLSRQWQTADWSWTAAYDGYLTYFGSTSERTYQWHRLGVSGRRDLGENGGWLSAGALVAFRLDGQAYEIYDYSEFQGFVNFKIPLQEMGSLYTGYSVRQRSYENLSELSYWEHVVYGRIHKTLPTRTTVIVATEIGYKDYVAHLVPQTVDAIADPIGGGMGRRGRGGTFYLEVDSPSAGQWVGLVRLSQSIFDPTGVSVYLRQRANFLTGGRYLSDAASAYFTEDELYDDRYGYESWEAGGMLSQILPFSAMLRLGYDRYRKDYQRLALDLDGNPISESEYRRDSRSQLWARLEKTFGLGDSGRRLGFFAEVLYIDNESNDPYYDYTASVASFGLQLGF